MRISLLTLFLLIFFYSHSQISFGPKHYGKPGKFKEENLNAFKNSTTIFVFSTIYDEKIYEDILKDSWNATPYKIVSLKEFNPFDYQGNYSIAKISGFKRIKTTKSGAALTRLYTFFDFFTYDFESINKKIEKLSEKKLEKKLDEILFGNKNWTARFYLYADSDFVYTAVNKPMAEISHSMFNEPVFHNYTPGMLKNYFQKVSSLIEQGDVYWMYEENAYTKEITSLNSSVLFIPNYSSLKTNAFTADESVRIDVERDELYKNYAYDYKFISSKELDKKILEGSKFYYLRYVRLNAQKFIDIVNSQTGEVIYRNYVTGLSYNIKPKHLKDLNRTIDKAIKKLNK